MSHSSNGSSNENKQEINSDQVTAVILAGGRGSRLGGQDKGLVKFEDKPLIEHVLERIEPQVGSVIINANRNNDAYSAYGHPVISDEMSDFQGPLAGFIIAMKEATTDFILTLPCDGPTPPLDLASRMLSELNKASSNVSNTISVAHDGERMQPVHALIPVSLMDSLNTFLENGDRKIDLWYAKHDVVLVDFSDSPDAFFNINKKEQLARDK